jgi:hypothetical protein
MAVHHDDRRTARSFMHDARRSYREAGRGTRIFGAFLGLALLAYVAYLVFASVATYNAIDANENASQTSAPQTTTAAPPTK